jgi:hypothetical protein
MARAVHDNQTMPTNQRFRFVAIVGLVVALFSAGISLAGGASDTPDDLESTTCEPIDVVDGDETVDDGDVVDGDETVGEDDEPTDTEGEDDEPTDNEGEDDEPTDTEGEGDEPTDTEGEGDAEDCAGEAVEDDPVGTEEEGSDDAAQLAEYTEEVCLEAAGFGTGEDGPTEGPVPGALHGLENAFAHVLWNCLDHPNHGLVNALRKLEPKLEAWLERQDLREERKTEREAAKAEREAARDAAKAARDAAHEAARAARDAAKAARTAAHAN